MFSSELNPKVETLLWAAGTVIFILVGSYLVALLARWVAGRFRVSPRQQQRVFWGFLFASPWIIGFVIFVVGPSLASLYYSFTDYKLGTSPEWAGLDNYRQLILSIGRDGRNFRAAIYNSLFYAVVGVPLQVTAALIMALLLNTALKGVRVFRLIFYLPVILAGGPAILLAWRYMFAANGGFVNETLSSIGRAIPPLDWVYRAFILIVEGFNGFFIGLTHADPTGPLNFLLPALIGLVVSVTLLRGMWNAGKQGSAQRTAELIVFGLGALLLAVGLMVQPIDPSWVLVLTLVAMVCIVLNIRQGQMTQVRLWQLLGFVAIAIAAVGVLTMTPEAGADDLRPGYLLALGGAAVGLGITLLPRWNRTKYTLMGVVAAVLTVVILIRVAPVQLLGGKADVLFKYVTLQSAIEQPDNLDYLNDGFGLRYMDSIWLFGAVALVAVGAILLSRRRRAQRTLLTVAAVVFLLITISSALDGVRYFNDYTTISEASGKPVYHFARFREAVSAFPDQDHNPKWLTSDLWVKPSLILINMWSAGAGMLIFLAALKGVPQSLYEAAKVDGASRLQRFFRITMPLISPAMFYNIVIGMIAALQTFETVYILRSTDTETSVMSAAFYLYRRTFEQANIGEGSAMSWVLAAIIVGLTIAQFRYSKWVNYEV